MHWMQLAPNTRSRKDGTYDGVKDEEFVGDVAETVSRVVLGTNTGA